MRHEQHKDALKWESIGILFDIDKLGEKEEEQIFYGHQARLIFMRHLAPLTIAPAFLWFGDTQATLNGKENCYCIAITVKHREAIEKIKKIFAKVEVKGLAPLDKRFCEHPVDVDTSSGAPEPIHQEPLPLWGIIDEAGFFHPKGGDDAEDIFLCNKFGWKYRLA
jgi:hypothetical protein